MKKFLLLMFLCFFSSGCVQFPLYHSHTQNIDLTTFQKAVPGAKVYYEGKEQTEKVKIFRSWFDKELVIKKGGFKDYHLKLESVWTDDKWAFMAQVVGGGTKNKPTAYPPFVVLAVPVNSIGLGAFSIIGLPFTLIVDSFNLISVPVIPIWNPWKEYQNKNIERSKKFTPDVSDEWILNYSSIILEPTEELKKSCNKKGYFISNLGCMKCSYNDKSGVVASDEELKRCPNRFKGLNGISYSCNDIEPIHADPNECAKCKNRRMMNDVCVKKCPDNKPLQGLNGKCYSCDESKEVETIEEEYKKCRDCASPSAIHLNEDECKKCPNRYFIFGRCEVCLLGVLSADGTQCVHDLSK